MRKRQTILTIISIALSTWHAGNLKAQMIPVHIELKIKNAEEGLKVYLLDLEASVQTIDSAYVSNGKAVYHLFHDGPFLAALNYDFKPGKHRYPGVFNFFTDSTPLYIDADFATFSETRIPCVGINEIMCFSYLMKDSMTAIYKGVNPMEIPDDPERINLQTARVYKTYERNNLNYIISHPNHYSSLFMLGGMMYQINRDTLFAIYNMLSDDNKQGKYGKKLTVHLETGDKIKTGDFYRDVSGFDREGKKFSISDFKGKVVLLDFWNMHCVPCLMQKPYLNKLHAEKYDSGLVVFSFFLDKNHSNFLKSTANDSCLNVTDDEGFFSKAAVAYGVSGIPLLVLIGRDGRIAGIFQGHEFGENAYSDLNALITKALRQE